MNPALILASFVSSAWPAFGPAFANHLWQSTLFAAVTALLTLALRTSHARTRHGLWLTVSVKFLIPFSWLAGIGSRVGRSMPPVVAQSGWPVVIDAINEPFLRPAQGVVSPAARSTTFAHLAGLAPPLLLIVWGCGCAALLVYWWVRWRRITAIVRGAPPIGSGREVQALGRLERLDGIRTPIALVPSPASLEPGVVGIFRPVLLWPLGFSERLTDAQVEAILAHELCHVRCRDNLAAAIHMFVEAVFWFHPLVWWVGARMVDERERACDEEVIRLGSEPQVYAESILRTCEFYLESPLACVAGVTGSDLGKRIERIMCHQRGESLNASRKLLLATAGVVALAAPLIAGALNAPHQFTNSPIQPGPGRRAFEVDVVKPNRSGDKRIMMLNTPDGGWTATNVALGQLIRMSYQVQESQIVGGPKWLDTDRFDILVKRPAGAPSNQFMPMIQTLLADRFKLVVHKETRDLPIYALVVARSDGTTGPRLSPAAIDCSALLARGRGNTAPPAAPQPGERPPCGVFVGPGTLTAGGIPMSTLATRLSSVLGRIVVDRTGLTGHFDFDLKWTPGPSIFSALQQQLGLDLDSRRAPVDVLVVDRAEQPTEEDASSGQQ